MSKNYPTGIQAHHIIPVAVIEYKPDLFKKYLPGWNLNAAYNLDARAITSMAAAQLDLLKERLINGLGFAEMAV